MQDRLLDLLTWSRAHYNCTMVASCNKVIITVYLSIISLIYDIAAKWLHHTVCHILISSTKGLLTWILTWNPKFFQNNPAYMFTKAFFLSAEILTCTGVGIPKEYLTQTIHIYQAISLMDNLLMDMILKRSRVISSTLLYSLKWHHFLKTICLLIFQMNYLGFFFNLVHNTQ